MLDITQLNWQKMQNQLPAIVQDANTGKVLMLGYMNQEALQKTIATKKVTFFSRSKNQLWTKGETSGNILELVDIVSDCDQDALLVIAIPSGPTCHTGEISCFKSNAVFSWNIISYLEEIIKSRQNNITECSYTSSLFNAGKSRIAQKVGEEGVEVALAAIDQDNETLCSEVADLLFHVLVLLRARQLDFTKVSDVLISRIKK